MSRKRSTSLRRSTKSKRSVTCMILALNCDHSVKTAKWIGDCFLYTTAANRLSYFVGSESYLIANFDKSVHI